jgi:hypothetical protein
MGLSLIVYALLYCLLCLKVCFARQPVPNNFEGIINGSMTSGASGQCFFAKLDALGDLSHCIRTFRDSVFELYIGRKLPTLSLHKLQH